MTVEPTTILDPIHPFECLRFIELPACVICASPTRFYCGGCIAGPAFCSPDHFMEVCTVTFHLSSEPSNLDYNSTGPLIPTTAIGTWPYTLLVVMRPTT